MAVAFDQQKMDVEIKDQCDTIPDNDNAKLMYYLHCIRTTIHCENDPELRPFTDPSRWESLSADEQRQLFILCYILTPDLFEGKVFFQNDALCMDCSHEFHEISEISDQLRVPKLIVVVGRSRELKKVMTYKTAWLQTTYIEPMRRQAKQFSQKESSSCCVLS